MSSMTYCAFENSSLELDQLTRMVGDAIDDNEPLDLNRDEQRYFQAMMNRLQTLQELMEQYAEHFENYQPEETGEID
jgi:hypothetical protein